ALRSVGVHCSGAWLRVTRNARSSCSTSSLASSKQRSASEQPAPPAIGDASGWVCNVSLPYIPTLEWYTREGKLARRLQARALAQPTRSRPMSENQVTKIESLQLESARGGLGVAGTIAIAAGGVLVGAAAVGVPIVKAMWDYVTTR